MTDTNKTALADILASAQRSGCAHNSGAGGQHLLCATEPQLLKFAALLRANAAVVPSDTVQLADTRRGWVYLAGPMTGYEDWNFPAFHKAAAQLRGEGWSVVNPADHGLIDGAEWADYLRFDIAKIAGCESIALLPGWSQSRGARLEVRVAQALMMPIRLLEGAEALSIGAAAPSAPVLAEPASLAFTAPQLRQALEFVNPDQGDASQNEDHLSIGLFPERTAEGEVHPAGLYAWFSEYPEEGSIHLDGVEAAPAPQQPVQGGGDAALMEVVGCFDAAIVEGLHEALAETTDERLKDLVERRLMYAHAAAVTHFNVSPALPPAQPAQEPSA